MAGGEKLAVDLAGALNWFTDGDPVGEVGSGLELISGAGRGEELNFGRRKNAYEIGWEGCQRGSDCASGEEGEVKGLEFYFFIRKNSLAY